MRDASLTARIEAAAVVLAAAQEADAAAVEILTGTLRAGAAHARLQAARALELLGDRARPALQTLRDVWPEVRDARVGNDDALFLRFSIGSALRNLGDPIPWDTL
jgi:hypothetical protein